VNNELRDISATGSQKSGNQLEWKLHADPAMLYIVMKGSLHFFTGENAYVLHQELLRWKRTFAEKHGPENLVTFSVSSFSLSELLDATAVMPFIAEKRLVIVEGIPKISKEEFATLLESKHEDVIILFVEPAPDKRLNVTKELQAQAELHTFGILSPRELREWAKKFVSESGATLQNEALEYLLDIVGSDQQILAQELRKLATFARDSIEKDHVELLAVPSGSQVIWRLTDLLGSGKAEEALKFVRYSLERGEDPYTLWSIFLNMLKNLVLVWSALEDGKTDDKEIASAVGMHFFAVRGLKTLARGLSEQQLRSLLCFALKSDIALKSGGYRYSAERPEELIALLETSILSCKI